MSEQQMVGLNKAQIEYIRLGLRQLYMCGKCGRCYVPEVIAWFEGKPQNFKCTSCSKGDYWDLHLKIFDKDFRMMIWSNKREKWMEEHEYGRDPDS